MKKGILLAVAVLGLALTPACVRNGECGSCEFCSKGTSCGAKKSGSKKSNAGASKKKVSTKTNGGAAGNRRQL